MAEHGALREHLGDELEPLEISRLQVQFALLQSFGAVRVYSYLELLHLGAAVAVGHERCKPLSKLALGLGRDAEQHRDAIA